jgi:hypothetical protein
LEVQLKRLIRPKAVRFDVLAPKGASKCRASSEGLSGVILQLKILNSKGYAVDSDCTLLGEENMH